MSYRPWLETLEGRFSPNRPGALADDPVPFPDWERFPSANASVVQVPEPFQGAGATTPLGEQAVETGAAPISLSSWDVVYEPLPWVPGNFDRSGPLQVDLIVVGGADGSLEIGNSEGHDSESTARIHGVMSTDAHHFVLPDDWTQVFYLTNITVDGGSGGNSQDSILVDLRAYYQNGFDLAPVTATGTISLNGTEYHLQPGATLAKVNDTTWHLTAPVSPTGQLDINFYGLTIRPDDRVGSDALFGPQSVGDGSHGIIIDWQ